MSVAGVKREAGEISTADESQVTMATTSTATASSSTLASKRVAHMAAAVSSQLKLCKDILNDCCAHEFSFLFAEPVDVIGLGLTDYHDGERD
jgi:hypothetical protein